MAHPDSLRHRRFRMTGSGPHAPRGTAGRGPNWDRGPGAGYAGAARSGTTRHRRPWAQPGPPAVDGPRSLRFDARAPRHRRPRDHTGTAGCGRADGATRRCSTSRAHPAVLTQRGLRAGSTWEPRGASGRVDQVGSTGRERLRRSCRISELPHEHSQRLVTTNGSFCLFTARTDANLPAVID